MRLTRRLLESFKIAPHHAEIGRKHEKIPASLSVGGGYLLIWGNASVHALAGGRVILEMR